jgi:xylulokinase
VDAARLGDALELVVPDTAVTGEPLGTVADDVARRHPILRGATVTMGGMDSYMAAHGQGVSVPGRLAATFGSSSSLIAGESTGDARGWLYGPMRRILPGPSAYWQGGQSTAGLALDAVARVAGRTWRELEPPAAAIPPGSDGLVFRETLLDRRAPWPRAGMRGVFDGLSLAHGTGHLGRAALEGVVFGARLAARPLSPDEIVITGGLAESPLFRDVLATAMKRRVGTLRHRSAAAFGAAFAHATDDVASLNPVVSWTEPSPADPAFEWAFERYVRLHNLPASVGEVAAPEERRAA